MKKLSYFAVLLTLMLGFNDCAKIEPLPDIAQPVIQGSSIKETVMVGNVEVKTGPEKDYEQDSDVTYKLTVSSSSVLTNFFVTTSSDINSQLSHVVKTVPEDAIDANGNFVKKLNNVVVYYAYHIDPLTPISAAYSLPVVASFSFKNNKNYTGTISDKFSVIKKGSTAGKKLTMIDLPYADRSKSGIGSQRGVNVTFGWKTVGGLITNRGGFFSFDLKQDIWRYDDAVAVADKVDLVGYFATTGSTTTRVPQVVLNSWNFVSPSDTTVNCSKYAGSLVANITLAGGATTGGPHTLNITVGGVKKAITYFGTTTTTTAANFVTLNKAAYTAVGIDLTSAAAVLSFKTINDNTGFISPTKIELVSGNMTANDAFGALAPTEQENTYVLYQDMLYRSAIRDMAAKLASKGKSLRVAKFKRLDNIATADSVSIRYFNLLSHDNEFDKLLGDCATNGSTVSGPVGLDQVWGFVLNDGRRGLIKTSPTMALDDALYVGTAAGSMVAVTQPSVTPFTLFCTIKLAEK